MRQPAPGVRSPARGRVTAWATLGALGMAVAAMLLGLVGGGLGATSASATTAVAWRGLLALAAVVVTSRILIERAARLDLPDPYAATAGVAAAGYALDPFTWNGRTALTQLVTEPGMATVVGDGALWLLAAVVGIVWGARGLAPDAGRRHPGPRFDRDRGAASIEWTGAVAIGAVVAVVLSLSLAARIPAVSSTVRWAICMVVTLGQGGCSRSVPGIDAHTPDTPCVQSSSAASINRDLEIVLVRGEASNAYEVARMSDGRIRVTELLSAGGGVEVGVGGGITVAYGNSTYGASATADASAVLGINGGRVWYVTDESEASRIVSNLQGDAVQDTVAGGSPVLGPLWSLGRGALDLVTGHDSSMPVPDEVYAAGSLALNASAEATGIVQNGSGSAGITTVLGARKAADGHVTVYLQTDVEAAAALRTLAPGQNSLWPEPSGSAGSGTARLVTAVTFDSSGTMVEVSATGAASGESAGLVSALFGGPADAGSSNRVAGGTVYRASLPIRTSADAQVATTFLTEVGATQISFGTLGALTPLPPAHTGAFGPAAVATYLDAAHRQGVVTRQSISDNSSGYGAQASGKLGIELGGGLSYEMLDRTSTEASYWDGAAWTPWTACG